MEESESMDAEVLMEEIEHAPKSFKKDWSPGPDGWLVEFFLHFFDLVKQDLWKPMEQYQKRG